MYFSFRGERKVPKESPLKESTQVLSLRILSPVRRALLPGGKRALCAVTSRVDGGPPPRRSAALAGVAYSRGCEAGFLVPLRVSGELSADGAPPFVRALCCPRPSAHSDSFAPLWAKGSRTQVVGSVREAPWGPPLRGALLVLFSRQGEKSTYINLPDKPIFEILPTKSPKPVAFFEDLRYNKQWAYVSVRREKEIPRLLSVYAESRRPAPVKGQGYEREFHHQRPPCNHPADGGFPLPSP